MEAFPGDLEQYILYNHDFRGHQGLEGETPEEFKLSSNYLTCTGMTGGADWGSCLGSGLRGKSPAFVTQDSWVVGYVERVLRL